MSTLFIENGYCCGHGDVVHRLVNYCLSNGIAYKEKKVKDSSYAILDDKKVELKPTLSLSQILASLEMTPPGPQSSPSQPHKTEECN